MHLNGINKIIIFNMEQTIKINVPKSKKAVYNESTQIISFVDIEPIRSKSWEEFCKNNPNNADEYGVYADSIIKSVNPNLRTIHNFHNLFKTKEDAEGIVAFMKLVRLHDDWINDWKPINRWYSICVYNNEIVVKDWICLQYLLSFPTENLAQDFLNCFKDLIEKAKKFI